MTMKIAVADVRAMDGEPGDIINDRIRLRLQ